MNKKKLLKMSAAAVALTVLIFSLCICAACQSGLPFYDSGVRIDYIPYDGAMPYPSGIIIKDRAQLDALFDNRDYIASANLDSMFTRFDDSFFNESSLIFVFAAVARDAGLSVKRAVVSGDKIKISLTYHGSTANVTV